MDELINFNTAKLAKEKRIKEDHLHFYTVPNSKMFGIDEHGRYFDIKNISGKLYEYGKEVTLNNKNVIPAFTQTTLQKYLREKHGIHVWVDAGSLNWNGTFKWTIYIIAPKSTANLDFLDYEIYEDKFEDALEKGLIEALKLIDEKK